MRTVETHVYRSITLWLKKQITGVYGDFLFKQVYGIEISDPEHTHEGHAKYGSVYG